MPTSRRPTGRPQTRRTSPSTRKHETSRAKRPTRGQPARPQAPKKRPMGLIIGGSVASASILALILILIMSGGGKKPAKKKEDVTSQKNPGSGVDEARIRRGIIECEKGDALYRKLKGRMHNRGGRSTSELQKLQEDLEEAIAQIQRGLAEIENSGGLANTTRFTKAMKDMRMVLAELK